LHLIDFDQVEESNLNRQGLFTRSDVQNRSPKSLAARQALARLFPQVRLSAEVRRVGADYQAELARRKPRPAAPLSAVDNARTRLVMQSVGHGLKLPVVQCGTDLFAADCFTQEAAGRLLDEQMHGALSKAAAGEVPRDRPGGCAADPSYVVPGMMAAALMAY